MPTWLCAQNERPGATDLGNGKQCNALYSEIASSRGQGNPIGLSTGGSAVDRLCNCSSAAELRRGLASIGGTALSHEARLITHVRRIPLGEAFLPMLGMLTRGHRTYRRAEHPATNWSLSLMGHCVRVLGGDQVVVVYCPWPQARSRAARACEAIVLGDADLGNDIQNVLGTAVGGTADVLDFVGCQSDLLAKRAGAFDFYVQDRAIKAGTYQVVAELVLPDALDLPSLFLEEGDGVIFGKKFNAPCGL